MVANGANNHASAIPPRSLNVQKFAESRASEIQSLHSIIASRSNNDFRSQRNKRRRTTGHDNRVTKNRRFRKKQKVGVDGGSSNDQAEKGEKKVPRRIRRRIELKKNPLSGYSTSGDGTKRLRTHVWHAKRFSMTKLWGFYLPLGLQGRGRGSRALLKKLNQGVLVHDASYYGAVQLEGPEDSLVSLLNVVMVPNPSLDNQNISENILPGITFGTAMLCHPGKLFSKSVAPVTYMWQQQRTNADSNCYDTDVRDSSSSSRRLWVWIHPASFKEGYDILKIACEQMNLPVNCISLEGELAQFELIGLGSFQLIQKILHPAISISDNNWGLKRCSVAGVVDSGSLLEDSHLLMNEDDISTSAVISLTVNDPRTISDKGTAILSEAKFSSCLGTTETEIQGSMTFAGFPEMDRVSLSSLCLKPKEGYDFSKFVDLWDVHKGIIPPAEESVLCKKRHLQRMKHYHLDDKVKETLDPSEAGQSCQFCPIILLKNNIQKGSITRWTIVLPLSWVKPFWTTIVSRGAQAIGLRERHWVACEVGLPYFPSDFPDTNAYSSYMATEAATTNKKAKFGLHDMKSLGVPILPAWDSIQHTLKKKSITVGTNDTRLAIDNSTENAHCEKCDIVAMGNRTSIGGYVAMTSYMLSQFLTHISGDSLLLFPYMPDSNKSLLKVMKDDETINQRTNGISPQISCTQKLCFVRVLLHAFKEGSFEEGAVVCAPHAADIDIWCRSEDGRGRLQVPQSPLHSEFIQSSGERELQEPEDPAVRESYRCPVGYITTGFVRGSKKPVAVGFCEAVLLARLRGEQWTTMVSRRRRKEIYVLVRNLRSTAYRLALASIVLEAQQEDMDSF